MTDDQKCLAIVLAAGEGTRMRASLPKVLHEIGGRPLIAHVLSAAGAAGCDHVAVVIGPDHDAVQTLVTRQVPTAQIFRQSERRGTAHAVLMARAAIERGAGQIIVMFGDTPLVRPQTLAALREALAGGAAVAVLGFNAADPTGYGRVLTDGDDVLAIREER
ncbi:MAG TPA: NTP transferase domain-containing protein, partial [Pseudolabrys sp.]|nr:NTP transferase domain-containing protein [Pseudolabrys sp.]